MGRIVIVGAGITGSTAALELARLGHSVSVLEASNRIGGKVLDYCCKATDECTRCGVCVAHTAIAEAMAERKVTFHTGVTIDDVRSLPKTTRLTATQKQPTVTHSKCTQCNACVAACPAKCITKYDRGGLVQYIIDHDACLRSKGKRCMACVTACPTGAISGAARSTQLDVSADAVLVATGHEAYDPAGKAHLGYSRLDNVITGEQAEEILSRQDFLCSPTEDVAFVQCVGSRDPEIGRNYCSAVCCSYATRMAKVLKYRNPKSRVTVYFIDLQNFDKAFTDFRRRLVDQGVELVRCVPCVIERTAEGKLRLEAEAADGGRIIAEHDAVVLSTGIGPNRNVEHVARQFGLDRDEFGFLKSGPRVVVAGTCAAPQSINDSMAAAKAVAAELSSMLPSPKPPARQPVPSGSKRFPLNQKVLVVGAGPAGMGVARSLKALGGKPVVVERTSNIEHTTSNIEGQSRNGSLPRITVKRGTSLVELAGVVGAFTATLDTPDGPAHLKCGAVVLCTGSAAVTKRFDGVEESGQVVMLAELEQIMAATSDRERPDSVAILLDARVEETKAGMAAAFDRALALRKEYGCEVTIFCREVQVSSTPLEELYDDVREAGVNIVKYEGECRVSTVDDHVGLCAWDVLLGGEVSVEVDLLAVSACGLSSAAEIPGRDSLGIDRDAQGQLQNNNSRQFPGETNRPGIFVAGACRGTYDLSDIERDARATALAVHELLAPKALDVEMTNAAVDAAHCALCLTCVRSCPHGAMVVDEQKRAAVSRPEVCQKCGICVGECPAGAIELPLAAATP